MNSLERWVFDLEVLVVKVTPELDSRPCPHNLKKVTIIILFEFNEENVWCVGQENSHLTNYR